MVIDYLRRNLTIPDGCTKMIQLYDIRDFNDSYAGGGGVCVINFHVIIMISSVYFTLIQFGYRSTSAVGKFISSWTRRERAVQYFGN